MDGREAHGFDFKFECISIELMYGVNVDDNQKIPALISNLNVYQLN